MAAISQRKSKITSLRLVITETVFLWVNLDG